MSSIYKEVELTHCLFYPREKFLVHYQSMERYLLEVNVVGTVVVATKLLIL